MASCSSPDVTPEKFPKKVLEVRKHLAEHGVKVAELNPETLALAKIDPKVMNSLQTGARKALNASAKSSYTSMTAQEKRLALPVHHRPEGGHL